MAGRTVLITGATRGIGRATALGLADLGARVALTGRDPQRTETVAGRSASAGGQVETFVADLSSQEEVRRLAAEALERLPRIDVLVNNVGATGTPGRPPPTASSTPSRSTTWRPSCSPTCSSTASGTARPARVVNVASNAQSLGRIDFEDLQGEHDYSGARAYNQSKLANLLFTYELARRLSRGARHRQRSPSGTREHVVRGRRSGSDPTLAGPPAAPVHGLTDAGAATSIRLASEPALHGQTGLYFTNRE